MILNFKIILYFDAIHWLFEFFFFIFINILNFKSKIKNVFIEYLIKKITNFDDNISQVKEFA